MKVNQENDRTKKSENCDELTSVLYALKSKVFLIILFIAVIGIFVLFVLQFVFPSDNPYQRVAEACNTFVGIILGVVAIIASLLSLFFSFYNTRQSFTTHEDYIFKFQQIDFNQKQTLESFTSIIKQLDKVDGLQEKIVALQNKIDNLYKDVGDFPYANQIPSDVKPIEPDLDDFKPMDDFQPM